MDKIKNTERKDIKRLSKEYTVRFILLLCGLILMTNCATYFKKSADKEVYKIIKQKGKKVEGMPSKFDIEQESKISFQDTSTTIVLSLIDAIETGVENSRDYQSQKEKLYSQGLSLTSARHQFAPIFSSTLSGELKREGNIDSLTGNRSNIDTLTGDISFGIKKMLATGADLSLAITTNLFRYVGVPDPAKSGKSVITGSLVQPILKGFGPKVALENLTQSERDMIYAIRNYVRFRRSFSVDIAKSYYDILRQKDQLNNAWNNYQNLRRARERSELMSQAGRLADFELDQTKQDEFRAYDRWVRAKQSYENMLDRFKITLGIPTDILMELDPNEMKKFSQKGIVSSTIGLDEATSAALANRLDLKNTQEKFEDAKRKVSVAKNALLPKLDFIFNYNNSTQFPNKPLKFGDELDSYSGGADLELPLDKKADRNAYRQSLINLNVSRRSLSEAVDRTKLDVRNALRFLDQAEKTYQIQKNSLTLAERRVESTSLLQQAGRASTRDILDAQESLLVAQNAVTSALVDHFNARLDLSLAMETLKIDDNGLWMEESKIESGK